MNIRSTLFWFLDYIKGSPVRTHLKEIEKVMEAGAGFNRQQFVQGRIHQILKHATEHTKFYSSYSAAMGIESFPVVDKNTIREQIESFLSAAIPEAERFPVITSGSTGTPFKTFQDRHKKNRNSADTIYFAKLAGFSLGEKLYYLKIWSEYNKKSRRLQRMQNIVPIDVLNLKRNAKEVIEKLKQEKKAFNMLGYSSAYETLVSTIRETPNWKTKWKINSIITMSESLSEGLKREGEAIFGCPVLSRYSNIENGIIAQQTLEEPNLFLINEASFFVEIFDQNEDKPLKDGEIGRIIITDLYNKAMPVIRYDTGDIGSISSQNIKEDNFRVLTHIEGRKLDLIYNTRGELISSYIVYKNMWKYVEIEQYQFVQESANTYCFKISMSGTFEREAELQSEFISFLGEDAEFRIEYLDEIPLLNSGKRKKVVNLMHQS